MSDLRFKRHSNIKLQNHYNKYGEIDLQFSILLGCNKEDLIKIEQYFIDIYNPLFNINLIAGSSLGRKWKLLKKRKSPPPRPQAIRDKIRLSNLGKKHKITKPAWNKGLSKETDHRVNNHSKSMKGKKYNVSNHKPRQT